MPNKNLEKRRTWQKEYAESHKEHLKEYARNYYQENKARHTYSIELNRMERDQLLKVTVLAYYSNPQGISICNNCGEQDIEVLCLDHIDGGGNKHRKELNLWGGARFYKWVVENNYPSGFQVLCYNCNTKKKRFEKHKYSENGN